MGDFNWYPTEGRYRDAAGRYVAEADVRAYLDRTIAASQERLRDWGERLASGRSDVLAFREGVQATLKDLHLTAGSLAHGGWSQMDPSTRGFLGSRLRSEYGYLDGVALDWSQGRLSEAQLLARLDQYGAAANGTYAAVQQRDRQAAGWQQERRVLGSAEHCADCPALAARGWQPIGTLPPPTQGCQCGSRCHCTMVFQQRVAVEAA